MKNRKNRKLFRTFFFLAALALSLSTIYVEKALAAGLDGTTLMYALDKVNVRSGPGTDTDIIGELEQGETIFAVEMTEEGWYRVVYEGEKGYIRQDFLEFYGTEGDWDGRALSEYEALYDAGEEETEAPVEPETAAEEEPDDAEAAEEPKKPKKNIIPILIVIAVLIAIIIYSGIQIAAERRQSGQDDEEGDAEDSEDDSDIMELAWEIEEKDES